MKFESIRIARQEDRHQRWLAYSEKLRKDPALLAYYTFESAGQTNAILPNLSAAGSVLDGRVDSAEWVYGRLPGKFALLFHGPKSGDKAILPHQERFKFTGPFSVAVWFKVERFTAPYQALVTKGDTSWRLQRYPNTDAFNFAVNYGSEKIDIPQAHGRTNVADGRWHLAAAVYEPAGPVAHQRLYIDGDLDVERESPLPMQQNDEPVWLGANSEKRWPDGEFGGLIDEVAIFARALSTQEVAAMFQAGSPANTATAQRSGETK